MIDPELLRQRRAAEDTQGDPKPLYRYRIAALRAGAALPCVPGDHVKVDDAEGLVLKIEEPVEGPERVEVRFNEQKVRALDATQLKIVTPHRPALLLGEEDLLKRLDEDQQDPHQERALDTLSEVARRGLKEGIDHAVDLFQQVEEDPASRLRPTLTKILRSRPFGDVEVALLRRKKSDADQGDLVELPALAAAAPEEQEAIEILDRFQAMDPEEAEQVALRSGRNLVGAGGPGFVSAEVRDRVAGLSREHPSREVRVALFVHAVPALQNEDDLVDKALKSDNAQVRGAAARELLRRGKTEPVFAFAKREQEAEVLSLILRHSKVPLPLDVSASLLAVGKKNAALEEQTLLRLPETGDPAGALELLQPWLAKGRKTSMGAALWCAGMLGQADAADPILKQLGKLDSLRRVALAIEALARLEHETAGEALNAWGVSILRAAGSWGEELVDTVGLLLGHSVDARELLGRFLVAEPRGAVRLARALDAAQSLAQREQAGEAARARRFLPCGLTRFKPLVDALS